MPSSGAEAFDHSDWTTVLERFVDRDGLVDYQGLAKDRAIFDRYLSTIVATSPANAPDLFPTRDHALAYYLNAYNAQVFAGVLDRGPEQKSVWSGLVSGLNFFVRMKIVVGGERMNLKSLEEKVILDGFQDSRVHAALNCASISCPKLQRQAFTGEQLDSQLDAAVREWVSDPQHVRVDASARQVAVNKIFDWFAGDFQRYAKEHGASDPSQLDFINDFRADDAQIPRDFSLVFMEYDKAINAQ